MRQNGSLGRLGVLVASVALLVVLVFIASDRHRDDATERRSTSLPRAAEDAELIRVEAERDETKATGGVAEGRSRASVDGTSIAADDSSEQESRGPCLVGRVLDAAGAPLPGARVLATSTYELPLPLEVEGARHGGYEYAPVEATTDDEGRFELREGLKAGWYLSAVVLAPDDAPHAPFRLPRLWYMLKVPTDLGDLQLERGLELVGRVVDEAGDGVAGAALLLGLERGLPGVEETVAGRGIPVGSTGANGAFRLRGIANGSWYLLVDAAGYEVGELRGSRAQETRRIDGLEVVLRRGARIRGRLVGRPVDETMPLVVEARPVESSQTTGAARRVRRAEIESDGAFDLRGLVPGARVNLAVRRVLEDGSRPLEDAVAPTEASPGVLDARLIWAGPTGFRLEIVDAVSGSPVERALVRWNAGGDWFRVLRGVDGEHPGESYPNGAIEFVGVDLGQVEAMTAMLSIEATGFAVAQVPWRARSGEVADLGRVELERGETVRVTVTDYSDGAPVEDAGVFLANDPSLYLPTHIRIDTHETGGWVHFTKTDESGVATLAPMAGEAVRVAVQAPKRAIAWVDLGATTVEESHEVNVVLRPGGTVRVSLRDRGGAPVPRAIVESKHEDDEHFAHIAAMSDADGVAVFENVSPGPLILRPRYERRSWRPEGFDYNATWKHLDVVEGAVHEVSFVTHQRRVVSGYVHEGGKPLVGATLYMDPVDEREARFPAHDRKGFRTVYNVRSLVDGSFRFSRVDEGEYELVIEHRSRAMNARVPLSVTEDLELDLDLPVSVLRGTITDAMGRTHAGLQVKVETPLRGYSAGPVGSRWIESPAGQLVAGGDGARLDVTTCDVHGHFEFRGVAPLVPLRVSVEGEPFTALVRELEPIGPNESRDVTLVVRPAEEEAGD